MTTDIVVASTRAWLWRLAIAACVGVAIGLLVYVAGRGVAGAVLLGQQQALLGNMTGVLGSLDGPPTIDLRAARKAIQALEAQYTQISALIGLAIGAIGAVVMYLRLEASAYSGVRSQESE
ncbi:MAG: hypothetical protein SH847_23140 [Roseiflexaceae bacterium]|nr:hypothetical protein [Roseiflexaceae bacterium]